MPAPAVMCLVSCVCVCSNFGPTVYIHKIVSFMYLLATWMIHSIRLFLCYCLLLLFDWPYVYWMFHSYWIILTKIPTVSTSSSESNALLINLCYNNVSCLDQFYCSHVYFIIIVSVYDAFLPFPIYHMFSF